MKNEGFMFFYLKPSVRCSLSLLLC